MTITPAFRPGALEGCFISHEVKSILVLSDQDITLESCAPSSTSNPIQISGGGTRSKASEPKNENMKLKRSSGISVVLQIYDCSGGRSYSHIRSWSTSERLCLCQTWLLHTFASLQEKKPFLWKVDNKQHPRISSRLDSCLHLEGLLEAGLPFLKFFNSENARNKLLWISVEIVEFFPSPASNTCKGEEYCTLNHPSLPNAFKNFSNCCLWQKKTLFSLNYQRKIFFMC